MGKIIKIESRGLLFVKRNASCKETELDLTNYNSKVQKYLVLFQCSVCLSDVINLPCVEPIGNHVLNESHAF